MSASRVIRIHQGDNVAVATTALEAGSTFVVDGHSFVATVSVPAGHKVALVPIASGAHVMKYGHRIGHATQAIAAGEWVHSHNLATDLEAHQSYVYHPQSRPSAITGPAPAWQGYLRADGRAGTRNEIWILNTVGCVNVMAERIARLAAERFKGTVDGIHAFSHPYGCSQLGDDLDKTQRLLAALMRHPNAGGVLVLGLGCESNQLKRLLAKADAGTMDPARIRFFNTQEVTDEVEEGMAAVEALVRIAERDRRETCAAGDLVLGMKCGGSDALSGLTANPLVGRIAEAIAHWGGTALLTEVPEMFGAEQQLMNRAVDEPTFREVVRLIEEFKQYFIDHGQPIYENPSPGNRQGGITTLEEKSLGAVQKGGRAPVAQIVRYGEAARAKLGGLALVESPGNDAVSSTALVAAGATAVLFTTGRGTPLGTIVPTLKIATNSDIAARKSHWFDFNAGVLLEGATTLEELSRDFLSIVLDLASGRRPARNEINEQREIAIWKDGVTL